MARCRQALVVALAFSRVASSGRKPVEILLFGADRSTTVRPFLESPRTKRSNFNSHSTVRGVRGHCDVVRGTYVEGLTDRDMWRLDIFEGGEYSSGRKPVEIPLFGADRSTMVRLLAVDVLLHKQRIGRLLRRPAGSSLLRPSPSGP